MLVLVFATLFIGGVALALVELYFTDRQGPDDYGDIHGNTPGRPRVMGYFVVAIIGFIAMMIELAVLYS